MTPEKTIQAFKTIEKIIREHTKSDETLIAERLNEEGMSRSVGALGYYATHEHLLFMTEEGQKLVTAGRTEKAMRWLGFLQGALWGLGITTIEEQKDINRPDDVVYDGKRL